MQSRGGAAAFTKRCNYGWPVVAVDTVTSRPPVAAPVFLRPFSRIDKRTGETEAKRDGGRSKLQVREPLGALLEDADR